MCAAYARAIEAWHAEFRLQVLPAEPTLRTSWVLSCLINSTSHIANSASELEPYLSDLLNSMAKSSEFAHLSFLLRNSDPRGSDVRLHTQTLLDGSMQPYPYPAPAWRWTAIHSYPWKEKQHINILEFTAFLIYIRHRCTSTNFHSKRLFHVLDSRVSSCVLAKGRSSSRVLNRPLRRFAALALGADLYVLPLWTLSGWNFCDAGSRIGSPLDHG